MVKKNFRKNEKNQFEEKIGLKMEDLGSISLKLGKISYISVF